MRIPHPFLACSLGLLACLAGCLFDSKQSNRGSVVENEVLAGTLYTDAGQPAAGASVKVYAVNHVPFSGLLKAAAETSLVYSTVTDAKGRYVLDSLPPGEYNILGERDNAFSYLDSIPVGDKTDSLPPDTLRSPGSFTARVLLQPNHDPRTVYVQVLGTNHFTKADTAGWFTLKDLAQGRY
jgi:hypothetical protein